MTPTLLTTLLTLVYAVIAFGAPPHEVASSRRQLAIDGVLDGFTRTPLVGLTTCLEQRQDFEFLVQLISAPRFAETVDDIVVEFGNARHQAYMDRYTAGDEVGADEMASLLGDSTGWCAWDSPLYLHFFEAIRERNAQLPPADRIRVLLAGAPIDWSRVQTAEDLRAVPDQDEFFAGLVGRLVLGRGRRGLLLASLDRLAREDPLGRNPTGSTLSSRLLQKHPRSLSIVWTLPPRWWAAMNLGLGSDGVPEFRTTAGELGQENCATQYDLRSITKFYAVGVVPTAPLDPALLPRIAEVADAVLFLGANGRAIKGDPARYRDPVLHRELGRRAAILRAEDGRDYEASLARRVAKANAADILPRPSQATATDRGLSYSIALQDPVVMVGAPVIVEFTWTNDGAVPLAFQKARGPTGGVALFGTGSETRDFAVRYGGSRVSYRGLFACGGRETMVTLLPGESYRTCYDVSHVYDFRRVGQYQIDCAYLSRPRGKYSGYVWRGMLLPAPVSLAVIPYP